MSKPGSLIFQGDGSPESHKALTEREGQVLGPVLPLEKRTDESEADDDFIDLRELWQVLVKRRWTLIIFTLITVAAVVTATFLMTKAAGGGEDKTITRHNMNY